MFFGKQIALVNLAFKSIFMKNLILGSLLLMTVFASAQKNNFIKLGIGTFNPISMAYTSLGEDGTQSNVFFGYHHIFKDSKWGVGADMSIMSFEANEFDETPYEMSYLGFNTMIKSAYYWVLKEKTSLYSNLGIGWTSGVFTTDSPIDFWNYDLNGACYQVTIIGSNISMDNGLGFNTELGLGYEGIFKFGAHYSF